MVKNLIGPPVTGANFYGRTRELEAAVSLMEQGNSLLLASPRRVGKSSFSKKIIDLIISEHQLSSWSERLSGYGKYEMPAQLLLNYLCAPKHKSDRRHLESIIKPGCIQGEDTGIIYSEVKQMLDTDGYLMEDDEGNIVFRSPVIRQYWFNKFVR